VDTRIWSIPNPEIQTHGRILKPTTKKQKTLSSNF
jgi:hypothetical protein